MIIMIFIILYWVLRRFSYSEDDQVNEFIILLNVFGDQGSGMAEVEEVHVKAEVSRRSTSSRTCS